MATSSAIKPLGIIAIIYGAIQIILSFFIMILGSSLDGFSRMFMNFPNYMMTLPINLSLIIFLVIATVILINGVIWLIGGIGLLSMRNWGRILLIIGAIISLFSFPIGTALGIIYLVFMFKEKIKNSMD